jgi:tetratricopeptide (TPR) repeat protein/tRNA A-37 threonylcarbamoyl transferase component Bud32
MDAEHWRRMERVLDAALTREPAEWNAVLDQSCSGDPELRREVEALLRRVSTAQAFLVSPPAAVAAAVLAEARESSTAHEGRRIGAYRIAREIGRGGMARVFLAERADGQFAQQVAIKLLRPGHDSDIDQGRFRAERQILASLHHPNIARLLDGGVTDEGQPYLVIEYVEGEPIDGYCDSHALAVAERLKLFVAVAQATQYAHRSLVVHRDLKPSNILVTSDGVVKLLDFGIAKLLEPGAAVAPPATRTGQRWMTPEYASPEQIRGAPVTTLTDVYQLGAVLYELLSGRRPFDAGGRSLHELEEAVLRVDPPPPSAAWPAGDSRRKALRGDLDAIVLKALRKEPERRYPSAAAMVDDIQRFEAGRPVLARPDTTGYRIRKFIGRNRTAVAAGALALVALLGSTLFSVRQMGEAQRQRDEARAQRDRALYEERHALASQGFMEALLQSVAPEGRPFTTLELLGRARELLERDFAADPGFVARMMFDLASIYEGFDNTNEQFAVLRRASELAEESKDPETIAYAECRAGGMAAGRGEPGEGLRRYQRGVEALATVRDPATRTRMQCLLTQARMTRDRGERDSALGMTRQAVALAVAAGDTSSVDFADATERASLQLHQENRLREALELNARTIATLERIGRGATFRMLLARFDRARNLRNLGEFRTADSALGEAVRLARGIDPGHAASLLSNLAGEIAQALDRPDSAIAAYERGLAAGRRLGATPRQQWALERLITIHADQGQLDRTRARYAELAALVPDSAAILRLYAGRVAAIEGRSIEALAIYMDALRQRGFPGGHDVAPWHRVVYRAGRIALDAGDAVAADSLARHALRLERVLGHDEAKSGDMGLALMLRARARLAQGDSAGAREVIRRAQVPLLHGLGPEHTATRQARGLADSLAAAGPT